MCQSGGQAASGTEAQALLPQGARQAGKCRPQCARFRRKAAAEGSLRTNGLRRRTTGGKCACAAVERSACPRFGSLAKQLRPLPCRSLVQADLCAVESPAWCSRLGWLVGYRLLSTHSRSRAKRGEASLPLLVFLDIWLDHHLVVIL